MSAVTASLDDTHDPDAQSWVEAANFEGCDFPLQNLPFGRFRRGADPDWRIGVAIGDQVLDLRQAGLIDHSDMGLLLHMPPEARRTLRRRIHHGLKRGRSEESSWRVALVSMSRVTLGVPCPIGDYTDFYVGIHHATAVGRLFRPDNPLLQNYKWVPIGYHGRASTILPSGQAFHRPRGQIKPPLAELPCLASTERLDFELEMGVVIGRPNTLGHPIAIDEAEDHVFGLTLLNDWSARDIQAWEYQPLGPFLSKSFASTISPWMVTMDALAPFRGPLSRPAGDPQPLGYLDGARNRSHGAIDVRLEVALQTASMRSAGLAAETIARSNFADAAYWTVAQLVTHHTVNGCALSSGDLLGTGTLSGPERGQEGSLLEMTAGGRQAVRLATGEERMFLEDGDAVTLRGCCHRPGFRSLGFGACTAEILPASS